VTTLALRPLHGTAPPRFAAPPWADDDPRRLDLDSCLEADHLARRLDRAVDRLDLTALHASYGGTGSDPYPPALLLKVALYQTQRGHHSPATWHRDAKECAPVRWLLCGCVPSRSCWYAFRDRLGPLLLQLNAQALAQALAADLTTATRGALDGTLVAANASRHRLLNQATLHQRAAALAAARAADARHEVPAAVAAWMAKTPAGRQAQQERLRLAQERLDRLQQRNQSKRASKRKPAERVVVSPSDPEAVAGRDKEKVFRPLYNVQVVDDLESPFVLGYEVFAQPNDAGTLGPMLQRLRQLLGRPAAVLLADSAYAGGADLAAAQAAGVTLYAPPPAAGGDPKQIPKGEFRWLADEQTYLCPQGRRLLPEGSSRQKRSGVDEVVLSGYRCPPQHCRACPLRQRCTPNPEKGRTISRSEHEGLVEALRQRMGTAEAKALYRQRSRTVELVNADWKTHRGLRRFSGRGLARVRCQVGLVVLAHNLVTLLREEEKAAAGVAETVAAARTPLEIIT
jgi:transposase